MVISGGADSALSVPPAELVVLEPLTLTLSSPAALSTAFLRRFITRCFRLRPGGFVCRERSVGAAEVDGEKEGDVGEERLCRVLRLPA